MNFQNLFAALNRWSLYILFFLLPVFFLPWTTNALEINKQALLVLLTLVSLVAWLGGMVLGKRLTFRTGWINLLPALFLLSLLVSSIFSLAGYQTWVGQASQEYTSFLTLAMFVLLFYVLTNTATTQNVQRKVLLSLLISAALAGLVTMLGLFGVSILPFEFVKTAGFNMVGTINGFATFLTAVMFMGLAAWMVSGTGKGAPAKTGGADLVMRISCVVVTVCALILLVALDFWVLWALAILGVLVLAAFGFLQSSLFPEPRRFALPLFILLVSVLLLFIRTPLHLQMPVVVSPSYGTSWGITRSVLSEGVPRLLLGSGPGTFALDYAKYRPVEVNRSVFWTLRFDRSKSHVMTALATYGAVGAVLWLAVMLSVGILTLARLLLTRDHEEWKMTYVMFTGWLILFGAHLLYSSNMTLSFLLWGLSGLLVAQAALAVKETDFGRSPRMGLVFSFAFVVVAVGVLATLFITGGRYRAEVAFAKAVELDRAGAPISEVVAQTSLAVSYNRYADVYYRNLSSALLVQARKEAAALTGEMTVEQRQTISNLVASAVNAAKRATDIEPNNVSNWSVRGAIYRDVMSFVQNAEDFAAATYEQAIALEPNSPAHYVNLGRVHLLVADRARALKRAENAELAATAAKSETEQLDAAEAAFLKAIELKRDYAPAHYYLAAAYERQGRLADAVSRLAALRAARPLDVGLGFQLSMLYIRTQNFDKAQAELESVIATSPNYSNALWFLASLYELDGDLAKATDMVEKVAELNPGNKLVAERLERLRSGQATTAIPGPVEEGEESATSVEEGEVEEEEPAADEEGNVEADTGNE